MTDILTAEKLAEELTRCRGGATRYDENDGRNLGSYYDIAADMLKAQAAEIERLTREIEKEEKAHEITIDQRDAAEEALGNAYTIITGQVPEWSNLFDYNAALLEIEEASARAIAAEAKVAALVKVIEEVDGCFNAAYAEGLSEVLGEADERMRDLFTRRIAYAHYAAVAAISDVALGAKP